MKKFLAAMLVLALMLTALCGAMAEAEDVTGEWLLSAIRADGIDMAPSVFGVEISMNLNADGSATVYSSENELPANWSFEDGKYTVSYGDDPLVLIYVDDRLETEDAEEEGVVMVFARPGAETATVALRTGVTLEDFNGCWDGSEAELMGIRASMEMAGMGMYLEIADGHVFYTLINGEDVESGEVEALLNGDDLQCSIDGDETILNLLEDGTLRLTMESEGMTLSVYFNKVVGD